MWRETLTLESWWKSLQLELQTQNTQRTQSGMHS